jgi:hypothetical protein
MWSCKLRLNAPSNGKTEGSCDNCDEHVVFYKITEFVDGLNKWELLMEEPVAD